MASSIIGYTSGVYDLFHVGHLNILRQARERCDWLIVGVSTDRLVMEYKGRMPVIPFAERVEIVKAIRYVDEVVPQESMDKMIAWNKFHFNRLFHGSDWKGSDLYNDIERRLAEVGVETIYFPYTQGVSSTLIKEATRTSRPVNG